MEFLERISEHWLKWTSLPFVFGLDLTLYVFTASELNDLPNISIGWKEYLLLAIPFILLFVGYLVWCCVHNLKNKDKEQDNPTAEETGNSKKSGSKKTVWLISSGCFVALAILIAIIAFTTRGDPRNGEYVIWAARYNIALNTTVHKQFYLEGDEIAVDASNKPSEYEESSILTLKFNEDDTFTIAYNGKLLGVVHGEKTGVNFLSEDSEYTVWKLVDAGNGAYYLQNVNEGTYLKWFNGPKNWTSGTDNTASKEYLIQLERVD